MTSTRNWWVGTLAAVLAVVCGGWLLLVAPARSEAATHRDEAVTRTAANVALERSVRELKDLAAQLPAKRADLAELTSRIPAGVELPDLIRTLSALGTNAHVAVTSLAPGTPAPLAGSPTLQQVPIALSVSGDYFGIQRLLGQLEDAQRAMQVTAVSIGHGTSGSELTAQITLRAFVNAPALTGLAGTSGATPSTQVIPGTGVTATLTSRRTHDELRTP